MDNKMRARNYYAAAVILFQKPLVDDCKQAIKLLDKAVDLFPDFSEASLFREEVWHCLLKSLDPNNESGTYDEYKKSPAWQRKRKAVKQRDGGQCVCGAPATEMHHKTYNNLGKEPLSELVMLCNECHNRLHPDEPGDPRGRAYWGKFATYVKENGNKLQLFPEPKLPSIYGIQIDQQTLRNEDISKDGAFWLIAFRDSETLQANLCMESSIFYNELNKENKEKDIVEKEMKGNQENLGELRWDDGGKRIGFVDDTVGHVSRANTEQEFSWLHERLIKLHKVFSARVEKWQLLQ